MTQRLSLKMLVIVLSALGLLMGQSFASECIVIGDSQSALSIKNHQKKNHQQGLIPTLKNGLSSMGYNPHFFALKGSGAKDWISSPANNKNTLIGVESSNETITPYQLHQEGMDKLSLNTTGNKTFIDQVFSFITDKEEKKNIDCFIIQLGDNDLFRDQAAYYMSELVKHVLGQDKAPRLCAVVTPTFKEIEGQKKKRDDFPFITNGKKLNYITQVRHHLQKNNLLEDCPVVSTLTPKMETELQDIKRATYDGLFYNSQGGALWAKNILESRPFLSRQ
jgi:hypothetical protein